ncbi:SpoIIE family protein phosphatase [Streptomyces fulvoviolaceus]|uniref:SpoIIE family protein phosphatase n=1 Tax=Streptomyces fulvoviolaceus TaxID=285535 RepID=UPI0004C79F09|nr:SpoIIE family protein phosphatase [Streptomyces fulvoviolaceus]
MAMTADGTGASDFFDEAASARVTISKRGVVTGWNEGARRLLGYLPAEIIGHRALDLLAEAPAEEMLSSLSGMSRWKGTLPLLHRDGRRLDIPLLAHGPSYDRHDWFVVSALRSRESPPPRDDAPLTHWSFDQSPCPMAFYDSRLRLRRANAHMVHALALTEDEMRGLRVTEILVDPGAPEAEKSMRRAMETGETQRMESYARVPGEPHEHAWSLRLAPVRDDDGRICGAVLSAHDMTEQYWARQRLLLLNNASTRIGSTLDVMRTAQELADVAIPYLADFVSVDLLASFDQGAEPLPGPLPDTVVLRRIAQQSVNEGCPEAVVTLGATAIYQELTPPVVCLRTDRPVVQEITPADLARWAADDPAWASRIREYGIHSVLAVPLRARGIVLGVALFTRHQLPAPFEEDDVLLAEEITTRAAVCIDNARRYTRERVTALTLQRSLLPKRLPGQAAVEVASRYLPAGARAGVGGDWFDVIPLSGARVALVVGDVVGHGIQASATMGRLRTAVQTLSDVDLAPDELLTHLDDLVSRLSAEADSESPGDTDGGAGGEIGATCLYAVYDPVSRRCSLARAGHPLPAVITPEGAAEFLPLPAGPPLGLGGLPFEAAEVELAEGSVIVLYTDGLVESRDRDIGSGLQVFREALGHPSPSLDALCDTVLESLLPGRPADDVALLVARTHALDSAHVATWEVPADPAMVAEARKWSSAQLAVWGLHEPEFVTELVVSELVTNAIRHAQPPIQLRLILDRSLICEVSDASNTAPHLRRARTYDEGGRGLLLVAQLTQGWGTRQTLTGKTIWAEQALTSDG